MQPCDPLLEKRIRKRQKKMRKDRIELPHVITRESKNERRYLLRFFLFPEKMFSYGLSLSLSVSHSFYLSFNFSLYFSLSHIYVHTIFFYLLFSLSLSLSSLFFLDRSRTPCSPRWIERGVKNDVTRDETTRPGRSEE